MLDLPCCCRLHWVCPTGARELQLLMDALHPSRQALSQPCTHGHVRQSLTRLKLHVQALHACKDLPGGSLLRVAMPLEAVRPVALKAASPMLLASSASEPSPAAASCASQNAFRYQHQLALRRFTLVLRVWALRVVGLGSRRGSSGFGACSTWRRVSCCWQLPLLRCKRLDILHLGPEADCVDARGIGRLDSSPDALQHHHLHLVRLACQEMRPGSKCVQHDPCSCACTGRLRCSVMQGPDCVQGKGPSRSNDRVVCCTYGGA